MSEEDFKFLSDVNDLEIVCSFQGVKYICTSSADLTTLTLLVGDGLNVWHIQHDVHQIKAHREELEFNSVEEYFKTFRAAFDNKTIDIVLGYPELSLDLLDDKKTIKFKLRFTEDPKLKEARFKQQLLHIATKYDNLKDDFRKVSDELRGLKSDQKHTTSTGIGFEPELKRRHVTMIGGAKKGHSVVNPTSRRLRAPKGISFN